MASENVLDLTRQSMQEVDDDDDLDETLAERLVGLSEMFPDPIQKLAAGAFSMCISACKYGYSLGRCALWIAASSATIMILPVVFESERAQQHEQQLQQQRQILLGPNAAVSGAGGQNLLPGMGMVPPSMSPPK